MDNTQFIKVWDIAIRVFHWVLVGCFAIAFISSEDSRNLHVIFGYSVLCLVLFRIAYGFVGTRYARFSDFLYHPAQIVMIKRIMMNTTSVNGAAKKIIELRKLRKMNFGKMFMRL